MKRTLFALLVALTFALSVTPAMAQGLGGDPSNGLCIGGNSTYDRSSTAKDYALFGCNGTITSGATVPGGVAVFGGNLIVEKGAAVNGDVAIFGGSTNISGMIRGDVAIMGGAVNVQDGAEIDGKVRVLGGAYSAAEGATVKGGVNRENTPKITPPVAPSIKKPVSGWNPFQGFVTALALAALGMLLIVFFPEPTRRVTNTASSQPLPAFGVGCLTMILVPVLLVFFTITLIGIPVTILLSIAWVAAMVFGSIAVGYYAGERILAAFKVQHNYGPIIAVFVGVLVLSVIGQVPCVGGLLALLVATLGLGAVVLTRFGLRPSPVINLGSPSGPASSTPGGSPSGPLSPAAPFTPGGVPPATPYTPGSVPPASSLPAPAQWYSPEPPATPQPPEPGAPANPDER